jgi:hypothetical protein
LIAASGALLVSGCNNFEHNDTLLFGTDTKIALDVSASAAQGGTPAVTIGYKRVEAVWMPLYANGQGSVCDATTEQERRGCGSTQDPKYVGEGSGGEQDAYSVFASFGSKIRGEAAGNGDVGIAQFFATGVAAQRLADNPFAALALSVQHPSTGAMLGDALKEAEITRQYELAGVRLTAQQQLAEKLERCLAQEGKLAALSSSNPDEEGVALFADFVKDDLSRENIVRQLVFFAGANAEIKAWADENCS